MLPVGPTKYGKRLHTPKLCGKCRVPHPCVPKDAPLKSGLFWWDCRLCGSTMTATEMMISGEVERPAKPWETPPPPPVRSIFSVSNGSLPSVVKDLQGIMHIIHIPGWIDVGANTEIRLALKGRPTTVRFIKKSLKANYFKEV
jgi:hypothetical protein